MVKMACTYQHNSPCCVVDEDGKAQQHQGKPDHPVGGRGLKGDVERSRTRGKREEEGGEGGQGEAQIGRVSVQTT